MFLRPILMMELINLSYGIKIITATWILGHEYKEMITIINDCEEKLFLILKEKYIEADKKNKLINAIAQYDVYMKPELIRDFLSGEIGVEGLYEGLNRGDFSIDGRALGGAIQLNEDQEIQKKIIAEILNYKLLTEREQDVRDIKSNESTEQQIDVE